ncbi:extracellular solute-binding protein [Limoniibacter endophyticus]|uniref:ABC transporter substrate-binding protein n=1 Tax=Limoniibacter endophyticus TaxID=1565040 RepID=A0A8J3GGR7_9HYPH|nr:extracellular solute-binding protein [Limoniibacter endophyticus]GHC67243.1 ABC transporter substrate-binding protein [Limoniibacter endophyticus]
MALTNRALVFALPFLVASTFLAQAQEKVWHTTSSLQDETKYGEDFERYDYVNPDAPKGGTLNSTVLGTFDSFNPFITRGTPAAGFTDFGGGLLYDTLMEQATDEPGVSHPLIAEALSFPDDYSSASYRLNPDAKWHDGKPIAAEDVVWTFDFLKKNSPRYMAYFANVTKAEAVNEHEVLFTFDQKGNRELPHIMGDLVVLPKHWWEGTNAQGQKRNILEPTLEPPLGSGQYKVKSFRPGSNIVWERVDDYWGKSVPVKVGRGNFGIQRFTYFTDDNAIWQAFIKGGIEDIHVESTARRWATGYSFPAFENGSVVKKEFPIERTATMQAFIPNMRKEKFQDVRVREALTLAFDFETLNRTQMFNSYKRTQSNFQNSELASSGVPQGRELALLEPFRDQLPADLFTREFKLPVNENPQHQRDNLRRASQLFREAGWTAKDGRLINEKGEQFTIEYLGRSPSDEVIAGSFLANLRRLGINATMRIVDTSQYINRVTSFDFDMITYRMLQSTSPGNEQRDYWGSRAADQHGSQNVAGIKSPVVDALVDKIIFAPDREALVTATHALDRVLQWNYYMIPQWYPSTINIAYWNKFGMPENQPGYAGVDIESWWIEAAQEKAVEKDIDKTPQQ